MENIESSWNILMVINFEILQSNSFINFPFSDFSILLTACEQVIVRAVPLTSITREKRVSGGQHQGGLMDQWNTDGVQIRSSTFQLLRVAFDEEVSVEAIESFRKLLSRLRHPTSILQVFAFTGHTHVACPPRREKDKQGYGTLKGFAKKTLMKTAKAAGLKSAKGRKQDKYVFPSGAPVMGGRRSGTVRGAGSTLMLGAGGSRVSLFSSNSSIGGHSTSASRVTMTLPQQKLNDASNEDLNHEENSDLDNSQPGSKEVDSKTLEKLSERSYFKDYQRIGIGNLLHLSAATLVNPQSPTSTISRQKSDFRISAINSNYQLCRTYPALLSIPSVITDDCLCRISRLFRGGRFPIATWRHPVTKALIFRGSGLHSRTAFTKLNRSVVTSSGPLPSPSSLNTSVGDPNNVNNPGGHMGSQAAIPYGDGSSHSVELEKFFSAVVSATPQATLRHDSGWKLGED